MAAFPMTKKTLPGSNGNKVDVEGTQKGNLFHQMLNQLNQVTEETSGVIANGMEKQETHQDWLGEGELIDIPINMEDIEEILEILPKEFKDELLQLFSGDQSFSSEDLLNQVIENPDPMNLLKMIIAFTHMENSSYIEMRGIGHTHFLSQVEKVLQTVFPTFVLENSTKSYGNVFEQLSSHLKTILQGLEKDSGLSLKEQLRYVSSRPDRETVERIFLNTFRQNESNVTANTQFMISSFDTNNSHMSRVQQLMLHTGGQGDRVSEEQFMRQIQNMLNRNQFQQLSNGIQQISLKLHPQSLGRLDINIQQVNGILVAKMMTTTAAARELIEGQLNQLRQAFQGQNIQVDRIEITQQQTQQTNQNPFKDSQEGQGENRREESLKQDDLEQQDDEDNFQEFLQDLIDMKV